MYFLVPHQNYAGGISLALTGELPEFEIRKAFSTDSKEKAVISGTSTFDFSYSAINPGTQALIYLSDNYQGNFPLITSSSPEFEAPIQMQVSQTYGTNKKLIVYANQGQKYYRLNPTGASISLQSLALGRLYTLPNGFLESDRTVSYQYELSQVRHTLLGEIEYSGFMNQGLRKSTELKYEFISESELTTLIMIFTLGKGYLPMWYIEDFNNPKTWFMVKVRKLSYAEPQAGYFRVKLSIEEF